MDGTKTYSRPRRSFLQNDGIKFVFYPIVLCVVTAVLVAVVLASLIAPYKNLIGMLFTSAPPTFDESRKGSYMESVAENKTYYVPPLGYELGTLSLPAVGIEDVPLFFDDEPEQLSKGIGVYRDTFLPGEGRTIMAAAHNNTFFRTLPDAQPGDIVTLDLEYGVFTYEVTGSDVGRYDDTNYYDMLAHEENLILYTCHNSIPFGATPWRFFVYCKYLPDKSHYYPIEEDSAS
jgi:sortase A